MDVLSRFAHRVLARNRHAAMSDQSPLSDVERKSEIYASETPAIRHVGLQFSYGASCGTDGPAKGGVPRIKNDFLIRGIVALTAGGWDEANYLKDTGPTAPTHQRTFDWSFSSI